MSKLQSVLEIIKEAEAPISLGYVAHCLKITPEMAENLLQFWIRKGRIEELGSAADCGSCGINGECPFVYQLPTRYQLVENESIKNVGNMKS